MRRFPFAVAFLLGCWSVWLPVEAEAQSIRAGAIAVDVTPTRFPVLVNGGFLQAKADKALTPLHAKALVLDDGNTRIAFVVVDSCMMPRELLDEAKRLAQAKTGIPTDRILISATHTHTAPAAMGALGCPADPGYVALLPGKISEAIARAAERLEPAQVAWACVDAPEYTHTRRWIRKPNRRVTDPFGQESARANMHPGYQNPDVIHPSGPSDPALTVLSIRTASGKPLAVLANYSMHYFGTAPISADYFGRFGESLRQLLGADKSFVGIMSQGTSGDQQWMDYSNPKTDLTLDVFADALASRAFEACIKLTHVGNARLVMAQSTLKLRRRVPDESRLAWARPIVAAMGDRVPASLPEVYAKEAIYLHEEPERELLLQSIKVGDLIINAIPNEVYAITGLKLKRASPSSVTMNIELANGSEGYIPPPEQHRLGGYTTWPARTAALEVEAEPKIVKTLVDLMAKLGGVSSIAARPSRAPTWKADRRNGLHYFPLEEMEGTTALDLGKSPVPGRYEGNVAFYLPGSRQLRSKELTGLDNRAVYLAGGRVVIPASLPAEWTLGLRFWNGLDAEERAVTGVLFASESGERLEIGGRSGHPGKLVYRGPDGKSFVGETTLSSRTWYEVTIMRTRERVVVRLGEQGAEQLAGDLPSSRPSTEVAIGGSSDLNSRFEGMIQGVMLDLEPSAVRK